MDEMTAAMLAQIQEIGQHGFTEGETAYIKQKELPLEVS